MQDREHLHLKRLIGDCIARAYAKGEREIRCIVMYEREADVYDCRFIREPVETFEDCEFIFADSEFIHA